MGGFFNATTQPTGGDPDNARYRAMNKLRGIGQSYVPNDNGRQAKLRRLRQRTRKLRPSVDQDFRLNVWLKTAPGIAGEVDPDFARMMVLSRALCLSEDMGLPFPDVLDTVLDQLEGEQSAAIIQEFTR